MTRRLHQSRDKNTGRQATGYLRQVRHSAHYDVDLPSAQLRRIVR